MRETFRIIQGPFNREERDSLEVSKDLKMTTFINVKIIKKKKTGDRSNTRNIIVRG